MTKPKETSVNSYKVRFEKISILICCIFILIFCYIFIPIHWDLRNFISADMLFAIYSLVSSNHHPTQLLAQLFSSVLIPLQLKCFLKVFMCYIFPVYKKNGNFFHFITLCVFTALFLSILYNQLSYSCQIFAVLDFLFD